MSQDTAAPALNDFGGAVAHFSKHPATVTMTNEEPGGSVTCRPSGTVRAARPE